jgi:hypothetical protein
LDNSIYEHSGGSNTQNFNKTSLNIGIMQTVICFVFRLFFIFSVFLGGFRIFEEIASFFCCIFELLRGIPFFSWEIASDLSFVYFFLRKQRFCRYLEKYFSENQV